MKKMLILSLGLTTFLSANIDIVSLDMFTNKTFVNQKIDTSKKSVELLSSVNFEDVKFKLGSSCFLNSSGLEKVDFANDKLSKEIEDLKENISNVQNQIKALKSNIAYLERTAINSISSTTSLKETSKFLKKEILDDSNKIYKLEKKNKKNQKLLRELTSKRINSRYSKLKYSISCKKPSNAMITYPIYNISKNSFYDINYDSKNEEINITNQAFITQASGTDFKNIDINLYTYNFVNRLTPSIFKPKYLDLYKNRQSAYESEVMMDSAPMMMKKSNVKLASAQSFEYKEGTTRAYFKASNVTLLSGEKTDVTFAKDKYKASDKIEIDGYDSSEPFLKVDFKSKKLYGVLNSKLYLDGTYVGERYTKEIKKDKETSLFFATNRFIDVKKELVKDMKEEPFFSVDKLKTQKLWKYSITNNHSKAQNVSIVERVPVSKHEDIKIKLIGKTKHKLLTNDGKIIFEFKLQPNESKVIEFGYEVEKPLK